MLDQQRQQDDCGLLVHPVDDPNADVEPERELDQHRDREAGDRETTDPFVRRPPAR
jgi:hypothetical protein